MMNDTKVIVSIADIHFGVIDPQFMYETLKRDFLSVIEAIQFDIVSICGDLFEMKMMSNNPAVSYAIRFVDDLVRICKSKNASIVLLEGTASHDNGQLKLFYNYCHDKTIDFHIVEQVQFEYVKSLKILCIPEKYGLNKSVYEHHLYESGLYDLCFLHGTYKGSYKGSDIPTLNSNHAPVFCMNHFMNCKGPILMGHYHIAGCYDSYAYYNGSALRYCFGQEQEKGFMITAYNSDTRWHYTELVPIKSHSYITINIDDIISNDPKTVIDYIKKYKEDHGIDYIRVQFTNGNDDMAIVRNYFRNVSNVTIDELDKKSKQAQVINQEIIEKNEKYPYITDKDIGDMDKFVMYVNQNEGFEFITTEELETILSEEF